MNVFFYNESFLSSSEKDSFEEDFINPISLKDEKEYKQEESKSKYLSPLNNIKSDSLNFVNMNLNDEKPSNFMKHKNIWKYFVEKEEEDKEEEENNENIESNNNSFIIAKADYSLALNKEDENSNKNVMLEVQNKSDSDLYIKEYDIDFGKENIISKNWEIKKNKISPLFLSKDLSKNKLIFSD